MLLWRSTLVWIICLVLVRQSSAQNTPTDAAPSPPAAANRAGSQPGSVVRDPLSGRTFYQQWVTETVPVTRWVNKQITTTTYQTQWVNQVVPTPQTVYQPQSQNIPQAYWKGAWNPFRQPTLAYEFKPVVTWVPTTTTVNQNVPRQQVVPQQVTITVPQLVTETKTQQRLVQTEIPQPVASGTVLPAQPKVIGYTAPQRPAFINLPLLAQHFRPAAVPSTTYVSNPTAISNIANPAIAASGSGSWSSTASSQAGAVGWNNTSAANWNSNNWNAPAPTNLAVSPSSGLRPTTRLLQNILPPTTYNAPMRTAASQGGSWSSIQSGMPPTVLR
jgi:hypothetical protein